MRKHIKNIVIYLLAVGFTGSFVLLLVVVNSFGNTISEKDGLFWKVKEYEFLMTQVNENELFDLVNAYKTESKVKAAVKDEFLCKIAGMRLGVVADDWSHAGFEEGWTYNLKGNNYQTLGENLAKGFYSAKDVLDGWKTSPKHNEIMLYKDDAMCVKCKNIDLTNYCVLITGR